MKLASLKDGHDGKLIVVNKDLTQYVDASEAAPTLQAALDNWQEVEPVLHRLSVNMEGAKALDIDRCSSPLPRAYHVADGSAYLTHVELVRKARGAEMPPEFLKDPLMYQAVSDTILSPTDTIEVASEEYGIDFEAEIAVITDDVPMGIDDVQALDHIKLVMLMNDVSLRNLIPNELGKGFGFYQSKPPSAFSPIAVTPDELGDAWNKGKLHLPLVSVLNDKEFGRPNAGIDMQFGFGELISHAARTRPLGAGTVIGSGTVSNQNYKEVGSSCLAEVRMIEKIETGEFKTDFLKFGDHIVIYMNDKNGASIFGSIDQTVTPYVLDKNSSAKKVVNE
jgi:fumarylacetoacetate (FAA) hydrolase